MEAGWGGAWYTRVWIGPDDARLRMVVDASKKAPDQDYWLHIEGAVTRAGVRSGDAELEVRANGTVVTSRALLTEHFVIDARVPGGVVTGTPLDLTFSSPSHGDTPLVGVEVVSLW